MKNYPKVIYETPVCLRLVPYKDYHKLLTEAGVVKDAAGTNIESAIAASLAEDREEAVEHGEVVADSGAEATCKRIAKQIGVVLDMPGIRWEVFGEPRGKAVLVVRSNRRRVDFRIGRKGKCISVIRVDENMKVTAECITSKQHDQLRQIAEWVGRPADKGGEGECQP